MLLVDDRSPDQTGFYVKERFPQVEVFIGDGSLYWAGGVRLILDNLKESILTYDGIVLLNDDILLLEGGLDSLIDIAFHFDAIAGGMVTTRRGDLESSGSDLGLICRPKVRVKRANGKVQRCQLLPGHIMVIPMQIYKKLNGFDRDLPYRFLDLEFTLRATRAGVPVLLAPEVVAHTEQVHHYYAETSSMRGSLRQLIDAILLSPKGPHWRESVKYLKKVSPLLWWLWLPFFYRAFFVAVFLSYFEKFSKCTTNK